VNWVAPAEEATVWTTFHIIAHDAAIDNPTWWRGPDRALVGEVELADGTSVVVVTGQMQGFDGSWSGTSASPNREELRELARRGKAGIIVTGHNLDRSLWFLDLPSPVAVTSGASVPGSADD
jgi:hypothetical protein